MRGIIAVAATATFGLSFRDEASKTKETSGAAPTIKNEPFSSGDLTEGVTRKALGEKPLE